MMMGTPTKIPIIIKVASDDDGNLGRGVDLGPFILY